MEKIERDHLVDRTKFLVLTFFYIGMNFNKMIICIVELSYIHTHLQYT